MHNDAMTITHVTLDVFVGGHTLSFDRLSAQFIKGAVGPSDPSGQLFDPAHDEMKKPTAKGGLSKSGAGILIEGMTRVNDVGLSPRQFKPDLFAECKQFRGDFRLPLLHPSERMYGLGHGEE